MNGNILNILSVAHKEDVISNLLKYASEASPGFCSLFLSEICGVTNAQVGSGIKALTRVIAGDAGIPDLVIYCPNSGEGELVIIENKLKAEEGEDQTKRYQDSSCIRALLPKLNLTVEPRVHFVYLTLFEDAKPQGERFNHKSYRDLLPILQKLPFNDDPLADKLLTDLNANLAEFYSHDEVLLSDKLIDKLKENGVLDGSYLYFKKLFSPDFYSPPKQLHCEGSFRSSAQGRKFYGAIFTKSQWSESEIKPSQSNPRTMNPLRDINVHFEPQFSILNNSFSVYLHYEINPYRPESWAKNNIVPSHYQAYLLARTFISKRVNQAKVQGYEAGGGSNQIGKATFNPDTSVKEFIGNFNNFLKDSAMAIDQALDEARSWDFDLIELVEIINNAKEFCRSNGIQFDENSSNDEYGIYLKNQNGETALWFGIWCDFWLNAGHPLSMGVHESAPDWSEKSREMFKVTDADAVVFFDSYWAKVVLPEKTNFDVLKIWSKL